MLGKGDVARADGDVVYVYDGSLEGFFCCVHESVYAREMPCGIYAEGEVQPSLFVQKYIETDAGKAQRVKQSIPKKIGARAAEIVEVVFLSGAAEKEMKMLRFLLLGYKEGAKTPYMLGHSDVAAALKAERGVCGEAHLLKGFIRFSDYDGVLAASITPVSFVLPFLAEHFVGRYSQENFLIYDKTHRAAMIYEARKLRIVPMQEIQFPKADEKEEGYRALWRQFYKTISIEARENPRCRMTHMPKRYWANMTEMQEFL